MPLVEVRHLSRHFGSGAARVDAVVDVSFSFAAGDIMGFIGPNGAGKSTTMRVLATLDLPNAGDCLVDGLSTVDDADRVRRRIGFMPDHFEPFRTPMCTSTSTSSPAPTASPARRGCARSRA